MQSARGALRCIGSSGRLGCLFVLINNDNVIIMNNGTIETAQSTSHVRAAQTGAQTGQSAGADELSRVKRELLQAEVRLAKARATAAGAEVDIKVLSSRLKSLAK